MEKQTPLSEAAGLESVRAGRPCRFDTLGPSGMSGEEADPLHPGLREQA
jgi:hypothetical protein